MRPFLRSHDQRRRSSLQFSIIQDHYQQQQQQHQQQQLPPQQQQHIRGLTLGTPSGGSLQSASRHPIVRSDSRTVTSFFDHNGKSVTSSNRKLSLPGDRLAGDGGDACCPQTNVIRRQRTYDDEHKPKVAESGTCLAGQVPILDTTDNHDLHIRVLMTGLIIVVVVFLVAAVSFWIRRRA